MLTFWQARRRYLRNLLLSGQREPAASSPPAPRRSPRKAAPARPALHIVPGYTVLVVDTNILLSALPALAALVEGLRWTVVVPLPVVTELDGLCAQAGALGAAAQAALAYVAAHVRTHAAALKVQTSRGNYLATLSVRTEQVEFAEGGAGPERSMDDLILRAAIWQDEHWVDRSALLRDDGGSRDTVGAVKVVLLTLDRNCEWVFGRGVGRADGSVFGLF